MKTPLRWLLVFCGASALLQAQLPAIRRYHGKCDSSVRAAGPVAKVMGASDLLLSPDGGILTVGNWTGNSISEIDTYGLTLIQTIPLGGPPIGIALVPIQ
jgi:YVTN family beta-propeller protein